MGAVRWTIPLAWKPGDGGGMAAIYFATIDGTADPQVDEMAFTSPQCAVVAAPPSLEFPAEASLRKIEFEYPDDPATPDWARSGLMSQLELQVQFGSVRTTLGCSRSASARPFSFEDPIVNAVMLSLGYAQVVPEQPGGIMVIFKDGWKFPTQNPFRATLTREGAVNSDGDHVAANVKFELRHTPQ